MRDEIAHWTEQLANEPASLAFIPLADVLRRARRLDEARRVALNGLERHPYHADAHDALARIFADADDAQRARDEWEMALYIQPDHVPALQGLAFLAFRAGALGAAERYLRRALAREPQHRGLQAALDRLHSRSHEVPARALPNGNGHASNGQGPAIRATNDRSSRSLFAPILGDGDRTALLLDRDGLVLAGAYVDQSGRDVAEEIGAELSGVGDEASRALEQLELGEWTSMIIEAQHATVALAPASDHAIVLIAAARDTQVGFVRRLLTHAASIAASWLVGAA